MSVTYTYPTNFTLDTVIQEYVADTAGLLGLQLLPVEDALTQRVQWDELDNERGMTAAHVMGTDPRIDLRPGSRLREYEPIAFKETDLVKENEILRARELGTVGGVINLDRLVARIAKARLDKTRIRMEKMVWDTLRGRVQINENGVFVDESFPVQQYIPTTPWTSLATAKPLIDFNAVKLLYRGTGAGVAGAKAYMNQYTANLLLENQNTNDLKGFQNQNFVQLPYDVSEASKILTARGLPTIEVYDAGYYDANNTFRTFIEDGDVIVMGRRQANERIGAFISTPSLHRNLNGMPAPGYFSILEVNGRPSTGATTVSIADLGAHKNPKFEITGGIYGGTALYFGRSIVRMKVN